MQEPGHSFTNILISHFLSRLSPTWKTKPIFFKSNCSKSSLVNSTSPEKACKTSNCNCNCRAPHCRFAFCGGRCAQGFSTPRRNAVRYLLTLLVPYKEAGGRPKARSLQIVVDSCGIPEKHPTCFSSANPTDPGNLGNLIPPRHLGGNLTQYREKNR